MNTEIMRKFPLFQSFLTFIFLSLLQVTTWIPLRFWGAWGGGNFLDIWQILKYAECYGEIGLSVYDNSGTACSGYLYGRTLLHTLSLFGVGTFATQFIGFIFLAVLAVGLSLVYPVHNKRNFIIFTLLVCSPPVMLLADRGNFDIVIFFALVCIAKLIAIRKFYYAYIILTLTVLLKFYTAPVFLLIIFLSKLTREKIFGLILFLTSIYFTLRDILITQTKYPSSSGAQFGFTVWGKYLNNYSGTKVNNFEEYFLSTIVFSVILIFVYHICGSKLSTGSTLKKSNSWQIVGFWIFLIVSISCYFAGMNFDYRLIFFASTICLSSKLFKEIEPDIRNILLVLILWLSFPSGGLQPIGDLAIEMVVAFAVVSLGLEFRKSFNK